VRSIVVISAHHESDDGSVLIMNDETPKLLFDYGGFPPEAYRYSMPNPGSRALASRVASLLTTAGIANSMEINRGHDHGVFVPMLALEVPGQRPTLPIISVSLPGPVDYNQQDQTEKHWNFGKAIAALRMEGTLIVGSGNSFHSRGNMPQDARTYDTYLHGLARGARENGKEGFKAWAEHPLHRKCHPRPEHVLPLIVIAGAASEHPLTEGVEKCTPIPHQFMGHSSSHFVFH